MKTFLGLLNAEMKRAIACVLVLAALSPAASSAAAVRGKEYVLENASIRLPVLLYNGLGSSEVLDMIILGQFPGGRMLREVPPALRDYYSSLKVYSRDFLLYGRMLRPLIPGIPGRKTTLTDKKSGTKTELTVPLVRQSAWDDGAENIGVFAVNTEKTEMTVDVPSPVGGPWQATFYHGASRQHTQAVTVGKALKWRLAPGRLAAIVFKPEGTR